MITDLPPLTWLRAFEASARALSFTHAAAELNLTQAAVSKHVKSLEQHLRQPLFRRLPRSLALTASGEAYLPKVQDALERLASGTREVFGPRRNGVLTLRCAVAFATNWLAPRLPAFLDRHPEVQLRVMSSVWNSGFEVGPFDSEAFDLDIQYGSGLWPGFTATRLSQETITPLCAPGLGLRRLEDLAGQRLLHVLGYQEGWGVWLKAAGAQGIDAGSGVQLDNSLTALALAEAGGGVALGRSSLAAAALAAGRLVAPFSLALPIAEGFYLLQAATARPHPAAEAFRDWLTAQAQR
jgi:LysR family transcriptional regulator, glycine cleavage system transcriptional activator